MHKLGYLQGSSRISKKNFHESIKNNGVKQHSEQSRNPLSQQRILKKAESLCCRCVVSDWLSNSFERFCWLYLLTWTLWYWYLYYKELKSCHQVFCYPESVNENPMVNCANFMQCIIQDIIVRVGYSPFLLSLGTLGKHYNYIKS